MVAPNRGWQTTNNLTTAAATLIKAAGGKGTRHYIKSLQIINRSATVPTQTSIRNGAANCWVCHLPISMAAPQIYMFDPPLASDDNTSLDIFNVTTGSDVLYSVQGFSGS